MLLSLSLYLATGQDLDSWNHDYIPNPLPEWVDALSMSQDYTFVNSRAVSSVWKELSPSARVGEFTMAIPSDKELFLGQFKPIGQRPKGVREVLPDGGAVYTLTENGFRREVSVDLGDNSISWMMIEQISSNQDGKQFLAWKDKFTGMWGEPTAIFRDEKPKERVSHNSIDDNPFEAIAHPRLWGQNHISMAWVWGHGKPTGFRWGDLGESMLHDQGLTFLVLLVYAEESTAIDRSSGRTKVLRRFTQLWINPYGEMAG